MTPRQVLAFDTSATVGSVALVDLKNDTDTITFSRQTELPGKSFSARLVPAIAGLLHKRGLSPQQLHAIVVVTGPGSFTGVRVGLSTAKGLAHATGVPVVGISRLAVLAGLSPVHPCLALLDAGRGEFYAGKYNGGAGKYNGPQCEREWLTSFDDIATAADAGAALMVSEPSVAERLAKWQPTVLGPVDACAAVRAAMQRVRAADWDDLASLDANYVRRSDAELFARPATAAR